MISTRIRIPYFQIQIARSIQVENDSWELPEAGERRANLFSNSLLLHGEAEYLSKLAVLQY